MTNIITRIGMGAALAATVLTVASPAEAQRWRGGGRYDRGDVAGAALVGGIVGLGVGAAIANRGPYYGGGYYGPYYGPRYRYYAPPVVYRPRFYRPRAIYAPRVVYRGGYHGGRRPIVRYRHGRW